MHLARLGFSKLYEPSEFFAQYIVPDDRHWQLWGSADPSPAGLPKGQRQNRNFIYWCRTEVLSSYILGKSSPRVRICAAPVMNPVMAHPDSLVDQGSS